MWTGYVSLSVVYLVIINTTVMEYSSSLGILSYFLGIPGIYYAIRCFSTEPGILPRGNIMEAPAEEEISEEENKQNNGFKSDKKQC